MKKAKQIPEKKLKHVVGGVELEEFNWRPQGFSTPIKDDNENKSEWHFEATMDLDGFSKKIKG